MSCSSGATVEHYLFHTPFDAAVGLSKIIKKQGPAVLITLNDCTIHGPILQYLAFVLTRLIHSPDIFHFTRYVRNNQLETLAWLPILHKKYLFHIHKKTSEWNIFREFFRSVRKNEKIEQAISNFQMSFPMRNWLRKAFTSPSPLVDHTREVSPPRQITPPDEYDEEIAKINSDAEKEFEEYSFQPISPEPVQLNAGQRSFCPRPSSHHNKKSDRPLRPPPLHISPPEWELLDPEIYDEQWELIDLETPPPPTIPHGVCTKPRHRKK
ncbi:hypothetical protein HOD08_01500 [bacterium]|nr:hypothetical protein [bacterium]